MSDRDRLMGFASASLRGFFERRLMSDCGTGQLGEPARKAIEKAVSDAIQGAGNPGFEPKLAEAKLVGNRLVMKLSLDPITVEWLLEKGHARIENGELVWV